MEETVIKDPIPLITISILGNGLVLTTHPNLMNEIPDIVRETLVEVLIITAQKIMVAETQADMDFSEYSVERDQLFQKPN